MLFEVMLSVALFAGAAAFTLASVRSVYRTLERSALQQQAIDLARSRVAELEAGLITLGELRGESDGEVGSLRDEIDFDERAGPPRWRFEVHTARTEYANLTLVELTVIENLASDAEIAGVNPMRYTLRQLVALREDAGEAWEEDDLMRGLPQGATGGGR